MPTDNDGRVDRRTVLKYAGTAGAVGIAGCSGNGGDGGDGSDGSDGGDGSDGSDGSDGGDDAFELGVTMGQMDSGLDPQDHAETNTEIIVGQVYEGLLDRDKQGGIIAGLANEWERTDDGSVRFLLRDGLTFHNGDEVTPEDVRYSIRRIVFEEVGIVSPQSNDLGPVSEVATGDGEVTVSFEGFNPIAFQLFATNGEIVQQSWVEENGGDYINRNANGTGPFRVTGYDSGNEVIYEPNEDYWDDAPAVDELRMSASSESSTRVNQLLAEETDIVTNVPPNEVSRVNGSDVATINSVGSARIIFLQMRYDVEPFSSQQFRQAMNHAVDVESIVESVLNGFGNITAQPTLENHVGYNPDIDPYPYDPEEAERLVEESGHAGVEITLETPIGRYLRDVDIAQAAASQIDSLSNVSCEVEQREFSALVQDVTAPDIEDRPHFNLLGWGNAEFDGSQTLTPLLSSEGALTVLKNDEMDGLLEDAEATEDSDERVDTLQEANQLAHDLAPWVFLHQQFSVYGVSNDISWEPRTDEFIDPDTATQQ
ncbi:peptide ABC transporter substrate-binding protein [Halorubrum sp. BOL3-1]|uniref:ABC transporter substrate-binding protein n=1 Tax=Halorubrum sp. BOL3-1 TaxID=2497325 RepID=UPI001004D77A|nr:ABC transporter substrate-binding protein [Halorubrum sp. BOL3-1]QAU12957.1 peptide ABC transporter substrate-binding protein [Halorubrum sp. BOL3-1]